MGIEGASGGGYIISGVGMILAQRNKEFMLKSAFMQQPMLDDTIWTDVPPEKRTFIEAMDARPFESLFKLHARDLVAQHNDPNLFPSKMSDELL